jgi:hypothetical protein
MENLPIVCTLSARELQERRQTMLNFLQKMAVDVRQSDDGWIFAFEPESDVLIKLANLVELERRCCPFLTFKIVVEPRRPMVLEIAGPPAARDLIADLFGSV